MNSKNIRCLTEGAIMIAIAQVLSMIKLWEMPWGGSVVLAMVPLVFFAVRWGLKQGLLVSFTFGLLQLIFDGVFAISIPSMLGDYIVAFGVIGLAGLAKGQKLNWLTGTLYAGIARFLVHWVVGATVWAMYMPDIFLGMNMSNPWIYSALYNACYMVPNILVTAVVLALLSKPMAKYLNGEDL